jgi:hypothetical protein
MFVSDAKFAAFLRHPVPVSNTNLASFFICLIRLIAIIYCLTSERRLFDAKWGKDPCQQPPETPQKQLRRVALSQVAQLAARRFFSMIQPGSTTQSIMHLNTERKRISYHLSYPANGQIMTLDSSGLISCSQTGAHALMALRIMSGCLSTIEGCFYSPCGD